MTKSWYLIFIKQLIASYNQGQPYFIIKAHPKTCDLAAVFKKLGIVKKIKMQEFLEKPYLVRRTPKRIKGNFLIIWLQYLENEPYSSMESPSILGFKKKMDAEGHNRPFSSIVLQRKQSRINFFSKLTSRDIFTFYRPQINVIHILETRGGLITSWEAIKRKQAGYILCTIYLLFLWAIKHQ